MLKRIRKLFDLRASKSTPATPTAAPQAEAPSGSAAVVERPPVHHGPRIVHRPIPRTDLDPDAVKIVQRLTRFDHSAYLVGGCVRDLLLDHKPKDFDIGTSATPRQVRRLFRNCRIIGRRFRLAHIYFQDGKIIEVATFRARESEDEDEPPPEDPGDRDLLIRDDNLFGTPEEDALRRDFTINALFYDINDETVLDHADGLGDLRRKLVRTIGDPEIRFREDPIRILRAIKFAARLDLRIESATLEALKKTRNEIPKAATPRILEEINRFCRGGAARGTFELMRETGVFRVVLPELDGPYKKDAKNWSLLEAILTAMDEDVAAGNEPTTGLILASLLLPVLRGPLGFGDEGTAGQPRGVNVRDVVDDLLRPIALRLRLPRKEQESCRQILTTLFRIVPSRRLRSSSRRSILARECLPDVRWLLGVLAGRFGGDFRQAADYWARASEEATESAGPPAPERGTGPRRRTRRRRRSGDKPESAKRPAPLRLQAAPARPPVSAKGDWNDDYFFSALPSAPEMAGEPTENTHYGAEALDAVDESDPAEAAEADSGSEPEPGSAAAPREDGEGRRRRSRRRRGGRGRRKPQEPK